MKKIALNIDTPCHESWDGMTAAGNGRFCGSCQKTVVDFTAMTDRQLLDYFKKPAASVCGRFYPDQLQRPLEVPRKTIPWAKYFFVVTWPAIVLMIKGCGVKKNSVGETIKVEMMKGKKESVPPMPPAAGGVRVVEVISPTMGTPAVIIPETIMGKMLAKQTIEIDSTMVQGVILVTTPFDEDHAKIEVAPPAEILSLSNDSNVHRLDTLYVTISPECRRLTTVGGYVTQTMGEVLATSVVKKKMNEQDSLKVDDKFKVEKVAFTIFPNPVVAGTSLTIRLDNLSSEIKSIRLQSATGQLISQQQVSVKSKQNLLFQIPSGTTPGMYYVQLVLKNGEVKTQPVVVSQ